MRAAVPVLLLVTLAGCHSVFSASLEVASREDVSDERVEIGDLQKSDETEAESIGERMGHSNCFGKAERHELEQIFKATVSSASEEVTEHTKTMSVKDKTEDEGTEAKAEVRVHTWNLTEETIAEEEERLDKEALKHAGERRAAVE